MREDGWQDLKTLFAVATSEFKKGYVQFGNFLQESGYRCAKKLFSARRGPTALFVANMEMAAGAIAFVREKGLSIPEEISIVTFRRLFLGPLYGSSTDRDRPARWKKWANAPWNSFSPDSAAANPPKPSSSPLILSSAADQTLPLRAESRERHSVSFSRLVSVGTLRLALGSNAFTGTCKTPSSFGVHRTLITCSHISTFAACGISH